ncbi:MAG: glycosyltransferase family 4 protein [Candidatus Lokiarchaeota archaeon]|nr:glycosyltransferase family 4 protein [Candidatus Lokiarchaeota archaeon]
MLHKILFLPTRFFPAISGAEFYFQRLAEILIGSYNYNIDIYTSNAIDFKALRNPNGKIITPQENNFYKVNNLKINRFPVNYEHSEEQIINKLNSIPAFKELNLLDIHLVKFIKNGPYLKDLLDYLLNKPVSDYDLIHTTFFPYFNCIISLIIGNAINKPVICTPFFHFSNPRYLDINLVHLLKKFDLLIACTNLEKQFLVRKYNILPKKIIVIPMGVDHEKFKNISKKAMNSSYFKQKFFRKREKKFHLILFCGYKNYEKGAISILKSIPYILKKIKKVYLVFIGPSTPAFNRELSKITKLKNTRIINFTPDNLTGYFDKKKIAAFREADIYLMPSRSDAFGIAFLEAWAAGKPVIGARIGATTEVVREEIDGLLVEFDNPIDIANKVIKLLKSKKLRKKLGYTGQTKVSQNYTWELVAEKTHQTYQNLIKINQ